MGPFTRSLVGVLLLELCSRALAVDETSGSSDDIYRIWSIVVGIGVAAALIAVVALSAMLCLSYRRLIIESSFSSSARASPYRRPVERQLRRDDHEPREENFHYDSRLQQYVRGIQMLQDEQVLPDRTYIPRISADRRVPAIALPRPLPSYSDAGIPAASGLTRFQLGSAGVAQTGSNRIDPHRGSSQRVDTAVSDARTSVSYNPLVSHVTPLLY